MIKYGNKSSTSKVSRRFVKRTARRVPRPIRNTGVSMKVEADNVLWINTGSADCFFEPGQAFINFSAILLANPAFVSQATNFMRYKITGCSFSATPCYSDTALFTSYPNVGCPTIAIQQYPILASQTVGSEVIYSDNNLLLRPNDLSQSKYWSYKNNFLIGTGQGTGTWNQTNSASTQQGQFSAKTIDVNNNYTPTAIIFLYSVRMCLYVTLDGKSR